MKRLALFVAVSVLVLSPAWAQQKPKAAAKPPATKEAAKAEAKPAAAGHKSRRNEDARSCLERGSNTEIIKCAEAYL